jgi:hypothetical protein
MVSAVLVSNGDDEDGGVDGVDGDGGDDSDIAGSVNDKDWGRGNDEKGDGGRDDGNSNGDDDDGVDFDDGDGDNNDGDGDGDDGGGDSRNGIDNWDGDDGVDDDCDGAYCDGDDDGDDDDENENENENDNGDDDDGDGDNANGDRGGGGDEGGVDDSSMVKSITTIAVELDSPLSLEIEEEDKGEHRSTGDEESDPDRNGYTAKSLIQSSSSPRLFCLFVFIISNDFLLIDLILLIYKID